jgi:acetyl-CoA carboxylase beta subunit
MGVEYTSLKSASGLDETDVTVVCTCNKTIVYNCRITFEFVGETLVSVSGRRFADLLQNRTAVRQ